MTSSVGGQVEDYLRHLVVERGLSDNTVQPTGVICCVTRNTLVRGGSDR